MTQKNRKRHLSVVRDVIESEPMDYGEIILSDLINAKEWTGNLREDAGPEAFRLIDECLRKVAEHLGIVDYNDLYDLIARDWHELVAVRRGGDA